MGKKHFAIGCKLLNLIVLTLESEILYQYNIGCIPLSSDVSLNVDVILDVVSYSSELSLACQSGSSSFFGFLVTILSSANI